MHPKFATDDILTAAAREYLEQHPELDPARVSIEFRGSPVTGYWAAGHMVLAELPGTAVARERSEQLSWYQRRVKALEALLARYRIGRQPSEKLLTELAATRAHIDADGLWRKGETTT